MLKNFLKGINQVYYRFSLIIILISTLFFLCSDIIDLGIYISMNMPPSFDTIQYTIPHTSKSYTESITGCIVTCQDDIIYISTPERTLITLKNYAIISHTKK